MKIGLDQLAGPKSQKYFHQKNIITQIFHLYLCQIKRIFLSVSTRQPNQLYFGPVDTILNFNLNIPFLFFSYTHTRLNFWIHELRPWGYHLTNVLLHALVSVLYYKTCLAFVPSRKVAQLCSLLFVAHPIHTEAVTGIVGRAELLSSVFFLLSILSYEKAAVKGQLVVYLPLSMAFVGCAMLCKEQGITVLGILVVYEIFLIQKLDWKNHNFNWPGVWSCLFRLTTVILTGTLLLLLRFLVMAHNLPVFTNFDNPASYTGEF